MRVGRKEEEEEEEEEGKKTSIYQIREVLSWNNLLTSYFALLSVRTLICLRPEFYTFF